MTMQAQHDDWEALPNRGYAAAGQKKRIFLKRGEGVEKRVLAPRNRQIKPITDTASNVDDTLSPSDNNSVARHGASRHSQRHSSRASEAAATVFAAEDDDADELAAETSLVDVHNPAGAVTPLYVAPCEAGHASSSPLVL